MEQINNCVGGQNLQMKLLSWFCKFQKQNRELSYPSERRGKPGLSSQNWQMNES